MATFEVFIPANDGGGFNLTLKVGADNWMAALKAGMQKLGEQGAMSQNVLVDIQDDNSIHVTEAASGRVFRIRELNEEETQRAQVKRPSQIRTLPPLPAASPRSETQTDPGTPAVYARPPASDAAKTLVPGAMPPVAPPASDAAKTLVPGMVPAFSSAAKTVAPPAPPPAASQPSSPGLSSDSGLRRIRSSPSQILRGRVEVTDVEELVQPVAPITGAIGRTKSGITEGPSQRQQAEDILAQVFLRVVDIDRMTSFEEVARFILGLALEHVPCEAGSVLRSDGATGDLSFVHATGPKAKDLLGGKIIIPAGTGIAGFSAAEGVSVAVSDAERDPRFYAAVGQRIGFETRSVLAAPMMTHGRSFGCLQLINRTAGPQFQEFEVGVLAYLAHQAALYLNARV